MTILELAYQHLQHDFASERVLRDFARAWSLWVQEPKIEEVRELSVRTGLDAAKRLVDDAVALTEAGPTPA